MDYIKYIKSKAHIGVSTKSEKPVLSDEDEKFLNKVVTQENPPPLPVVEHHGDAQLALMNGAQNIALPPETPGELIEEPKDLIDVASKVKPKRSTWSWIRRDSRDSKRKDTAEGLHNIAESLKSNDDAEEDSEVAEAKKEEEEMTIVLEQLNLAAVNNTVFSISDETQELLQNFNQVLKDLINGVPTAYRDLESLLTNGDKQIQKTYNSLPSFLQKLVEKFPEAMTKGIAPEMMAVAASRASSYGINLEKTGKAAGVASKFMKTPSLKDLVGKPGAVTGMLRSIMEFLRTRFPAFAGINVLWSMALFLLLIVFWYCHKRGKEVRLEKERKLTEQEMQQLETEWKDVHSQGEDTTTAIPQTTTTAPPGASMEEVKAGIIAASQAREEAGKQASEPTASASVP